MLSFQLNWRAGALHLQKTKRDRGIYLPDGRTDRKKCVLWMDSLLLHFLLSVVQELPLASPITVIESPCSLEFMNSDGALCKIDRGAQRECFNFHLHLIDLLAPGIESPTLPPAVDILRVFHSFRASYIRKCPICSTKQVVASSSSRKQVVVH